MLARPVKRGATGCAGREVGRSVFRAWVLCCVAFATSLPPALSYGETAALCLATRDRGRFTWPICNSLVVMPALCMSEEEWQHAISAIRAAARISSM